ncbi:MAG: hypothetical protein JST82_01510 [Bacteroidetes bacterium]|nr:hypothetical protein [Bacteroidota bacterium]
MMWFSDIKQLQYYNPTPGVACYCEELMYPGDMILQGSIPAGTGTGNYSISIEVWSTDGLTIYEVATSYFDYYFFTNPSNGLHYFTARLKSFSPAMCSHQCFLMRVGVTNTGSPNNYLFANWTERYCVSDCCDTAKGITVVQSGLVYNPGGPTDVAVVTPAGKAKTDPCGEPLIRLISQFDCEDKFSGEYYGKPTNVLSGSFIPFVKITTMKGRIVRKPREIKREISYNCRLQQAESTAQYLLEGFELFPAWKMAEIENQLHANHIWVDDFSTYKEYQYAGGTAFKQVSKCAELFKLETYLQDCTQRQIFGCGDCANAVSYNGSQLMFVIPGAYNGGAFYNEAKAMVAEDYDGLLLYLRSLNGVTEVSDADISSLDCEIYKVAGISGTASLPSFIYYDIPTPRNKIYGKVVQDVQELCDGVNTCLKPVAGTISITDVVCADVETGTITVTEIAPDEILVRSAADWLVDAEISRAYLYGGQVKLTVKSFNSAFTAAPDEAVLLDHEVIGIVDAAARPRTLAVLTNANNDTIPIDMFVSIDNMGLIRIAGEPTTIDETGATVELHDLVYNI